ncbi:MAG: LysR family transcriptional regulator [Coriobacteriia bacterium]|nr:LysR family transcriptional regulator [Coriobacteriia bacterium]
MNTIQLKYFEAACRCGSFTKAARETSISVQGLTKSLRSLEKELGVELFRHEGRNACVPTEYAEALLRYVERDTASHSELMNDINRIRMRKLNRLTVCFAIGVLGYLGPHFIDTFCEQNPDISLGYTDAADYACDEELRAGRCDIALTLAPFSSDFDTRSIHTTTTSFWVRRGDPLFGREVLKASDFVGRRIAMPGPDFKCYASIMSSFEGVAGRPAATYFSSAMFWLYNYTLEGNGPAFGGGHLKRLPFFNRDGMRLIPFDVVTWGFGVSTLRGAELSDASRRFWNYCLNAHGSPNTWLTDKSGSA